MEKYKNRSTFANFAFSSKELFSNVQVSIFEIEEVLSKIALKPRGLLLDSPIWPLIQSGVHLWARVLELDSTVLSNVQNRDERVILFYGISIRGKIDERLHRSPLNRRLTVCVSNNNDRWLYRLFFNPCVSSFHQISQKAKSSFLTLSLREPFPC